MIPSISGYKLISSPFALTQGPDREIMVSRSWRERLFSRPWKPWVKERKSMCVTFIPAIYKDENRKCIYYHPSFDPIIKKWIKDNKSYNFPGIQPF